MFSPLFPSLRAWLRSNFRARRRPLRRRLQLEQLEPRNLMDGNVPMLPFSPNLGLFTTRVNYSIADPNAQAMLGQIIAEETAVYNWLVQIEQQWIQAIDKLFLAELQLLEQLDPQLAPFLSGLFPGVNQGAGGNGSGTSGTQPPSGGPGSGSQPPPTGGGFQLQEFPHRPFPASYNHPYAQQAGSASLDNLASGYQAAQQNGTVSSFLAYESQEFVLDSKGRVLVNVRAQTPDQVSTMQQSLVNIWGMTVTTVTPEQAMVTGWLPIADNNGSTLKASVPGFQAIVPVWAPVFPASVATSASALTGDHVMQTDSYRSATGDTGSGVIVGVLSDTVQNPGSNVTVLQNGLPGQPDYGGAMLQTIQQVAPGASLAFASADYGPQAMAQSIQQLTTQQHAGVIVDGALYPNEPFFNSGVVSQAVTQAASNNVVYVTAAGDTGANGWEGAFRPVTATVGGVQGTFENFLTGSNTNVLQQFTLQPGQTLNLVFQWDAPFLEGGSQMADYQVPNWMGVLVTTADGSKVVAQFSDNTENTDEAMQRVLFTNDGTHGTNNFALAFQLTDGSAPTKLKWVRFDNNAAAQYQGSATLFGHAAAGGAVSVAAANVSQPNQPEPFTANGPVERLFGFLGQPLSKSQTVAAPTLMGPDGGYTSSFASFQGTSAAAANVAGAAALLRQQYSNLNSYIIGEMLKLSGANANNPPSSVSGAGMLQLKKTLTPPAQNSVLNSSAGLQATTGIVDATPINGGDFGEPAVAIDPLNTDNVFIAAVQGISTDSSGQLLGIMTARSTDGGKTFTNKLIAAGNDSLPEACCDPVLTWDNFGNLFLTYIGNLTAFPSGAAFVLLSTDGGQTFTDIGNFLDAADQPKVVFGPGGAQAPGSVWVTYLDQSNRIVARGAPVTGLGQVGAFSAPKIAPSPGVGNFGDIAVGPQGQVVVTYQTPENNAGPSDIFVNIDAGGLGGGFGPAILATPTNVGGFDFIAPQIDRSVDAEAKLAWDRSGGQFNGRLYLVYTDSPSVSSPTTQIFVRHSDNSGQTWSAPALVNDDPNSPRSSFLPAIAVDESTGNLVVTFYDARNDPGFGPGDTDGKPDTDVQYFAALSVNGGGCFSTNVALDPNPSNAVSTTAGIFGGFDFGDYSRVAFVKGHIHPVWADNSQSLVGQDPDLPHLNIATIGLLAPSLVGLGPEEPDETSDAAHNLGVLTSPEIVPNLSITTLPNGLPDYDWFRWSAGQFGTFNVTLNEFVSTGALEMHVFTLASDNTLIELGSVSGATSSTCHGNFSLSFSGIKFGDPLLVEVKGAESSPGVFGRGLYSLTASMS